MDHGPISKLRYFSRSVYLLFCFSFFVLFFFFFFFCFVLLRTWKVWYESVNINPIVKRKKGKKQRNMIKNYPDRDTWQNRIGQ